MDYKSIGKEVIEKEIKALELLVTKIDDQFDWATEIILRRKGRVIISGVGKAGIIGKKMAASFSSLGTASFFMHPTEAAHGDLGMVDKGDIVILISNSGSSSEVIKIIPFLKMIGSKIIAITGSENSTLGKDSDICLNIGRHEEACGMNLAPTTSTTAILAMADALVVSVMKGYKNFNEKSFAYFHPAGALGKKLMRVEDIMNTKVPKITPDISFREVIMAITSKKAGIALVVSSSSQKLVGIFSDGDLRRLLSKEKFSMDIPIKDVMIKDPKFISPHIYIQEALGLFKKYRVGDLPVIGEKREVLGVLSLKDLVEIGII